MDQQPKLLIVIGSTRPGRVGLPVAYWFVEQARAFGGFDVQIADLAELALPLMNEPNHPRLRQYTHEHTRRWSGMVDRSDAFVLVLPEYNHGFTAPVKNALDYLLHEWAYKPVGFVSYGGIAAGTRAVQLLKPVLVGLKLTPVVEAVNIPWVSQHVHDGTFAPEESLARAAHVMLVELERTASALRALRAPSDSSPR
ncbi:MAG: NAD(P)H-dependent oxidoreductase [Chloroflexota bacterium]